MRLEDLTKIPQLSYKLPGSYFNIVNFTPVIQYIHNNSVKNISEFDDEIKLNSSQHKKFVFHYFIYYTFEQKFPVLIVREDFSLKELKKKCKCDGFKEELQIILLRKLKKVQNTNFYFNKLHYFCKKYNLTFLDKTYFEDIRNKLSLL